MSKGQGAPGILHPALPRPPLPMQFSLHTVWQQGGLRVLFFYF